MLAVLLLPTAACTDDDSEAPAGADDRAGTTSTATTAQPAASDSAAAFPIVEGVVLEATALANELFQDPSKADDEGSATVARFRELHTADSPTPDGVLAQLRALKDNGHRYRPGPSGALRDLGVYRLTAVNDDTIQLRVCAVEDIEVVDASGTVVEARSQITQGDGEARRNAGVWRFVGIRPDETATLPIAPGSAPAGFCDQLLEGTLEGTQP
jgi:hypothetical protein